MNAQTYYDLHCTLEKLAKVISRAQYKDDRMGNIPPHAMGDVLADVADALATISDLTGSSRIRGE